MIATIDIDTIKTRMKAMWMSGDYVEFAQYLEPGALEILNGWNIAPGSRMLDVGCGAGQIAIPAARAGVQVMAVDIATNLVQAARSRAALEGLPVRFEEGDAEQLFFPDGSFDVVVSLIGAMFAPRPEKVAAEMTRVCRPGGRIMMANWTPEGVIGQMFKVHAKHVPPPPGVPSPVLWGDEETVSKRFNDGIAQLKLTRRIYISFRYPFGPAGVVEYYRRYYGPTNRAFASLDEEGQAALRRDLEEFWAENNIATDGGTWVEAEYLDVVAVRG